VRVYVKWAPNDKIKEVTQEFSRDLAAKGADIISHHNTLAKRQFSREYGVYTIKKDENGDIVPDTYLATPVWNWGIFYEKYVRSVLAGSTKLGADNAVHGRMRNYWWGLDSGLLDFFYARNHLPSDTCKFIEFVKSSLIAQNYKVFVGPIYDNGGKLIVSEGEELTREQILSMNWLADGIEGELPNIVRRTGQDLSAGKII